MATTKSNIGSLKLFYSCWLY